MILSLRVESQDEFLERPLDSRENRFFMRTQGFDQNAANARKIGRSDIGKDLVADDGRVLRVEMLRSHRLFAAARKRLESGGVKRQIEFVRQPPDAAFSPVGQQAEGKALPLFAFEPFQNFGQQGFASIVFQRAIDVEQHVENLLPLEPLTMNLRDAFETMVGEEKIEHVIVFILKIRKAGSC